MPPKGEYARCPAPLSSPGMRRAVRRLPLLLGIAIGMLAAPADAQWVRLQRCSGALPCALPFGIRYDPDPLIAGQFGQASPTGISARIALDTKPTVELDKSPFISVDFAAEAARRFVLAHPPPSRAKSKPAPTPSRQR